MRKRLSRDSRGLGGGPGAFATLLVCSTFAISALGAFPALAVSPAAPAKQAPVNAEPAARAEAVAERQLLWRLDAPLLFVKRHSYQGIHIYDTFYKWPPGGGGIYVLENPGDPRQKWRIRAVIDESSPNSLGKGVYSHPDLSWDASRLVFCYKGEPNGSTKIYEIGIDGKGLRMVSDPTPQAACYKGAHAGMHDVAPAYLPDGRIVFSSTRAAGLVPCANSGVAILHVMNPDGSDIHPISVNAETEFDPAVLPDGRIIFGRWEYVDKNALTIQSLWTIYPDGSNETAVYANNMVFPEATLDVRPVPGSHLLAMTFAKHNSTPRGSIAMVDPLMGKNDPNAAYNFEHPKNPLYDRGDSCEPYPLDENTVVFSGRPAGQKRNVIEMINRLGERIVVLSDPAICLHSPILVKPRPAPDNLPDKADRGLKHGAFFVQDVYAGLTGIKPGEAKWLRVVEETSRVSASPHSPNPFNQTFLVSAALAFATKIYHGMVPIGEDGSVYFEAPAGRALYFQVLDKDKRLIQSMRTFIQAAPGTTRSCIGCHEDKSSVPKYSTGAVPGQPARLKPESWGTGYMDYPSMVQPVWDKHCVSCHGGENGFAARLDLTGGWTTHFNNSYENLADRRQTQLTAYLIDGIDCMNGTANWSCRIFKPRSFGSATAPLAKVIASGHKGRIANLTATERDLVMAWIDCNGLYYGSWDYTAHGYALGAWGATASLLQAEMVKAKCTDCHSNNIGGDWINLQTPELSRMLRAPLAAGADANAKGFGAAICKNHPMDPRRIRTRLLRNGYAHAVQPIEAFAPQPVPPAAEGSKTQPSFQSTGDPRYQAMLEIIRKGRQAALATPRVDMPGAQVIAGASRMFIPPPVPAQAPVPQARIDDGGAIGLLWERSAGTIGLEAEIHRGPAKDFIPSERTLIARTILAHYLDREAPAGKQHYALILRDGAACSKPSFITVDVPGPAEPIKSARRP